MKLKELIDSIFFYLSVPKCVGCGERLRKEENVLCDGCTAEYENVKRRNCSICSNTLDRCVCTNKYLDAHYVHKLIKVYRYLPDDKLPSNRLIYSLKRDNRSDVLELLSGELYSAVLHSVKDPSEYVFTNVPRSRKSTVKYGYDHAALLAKSLAKRFSATYYQPLISKSKQPQKKTSGEERLHNARFAVKKNAEDLTDKKIILVDDIVTTGASLGASAMHLKSLGAKQIIGAAVAIAYKDRYVPLDKNDRFLPNKK